MNGSGIRADHGVWRAARRVSDQDAQHSQVRFRRAALRAWLKIEEVGALTESQRTKIFNVFQREWDQLPGLLDSSMPRTAEREWTFLRFLPSASRAHAFGRDARSAFSSTAALVEQLDIVFNSLPTKNFKQERQRWAAWFEDWTDAWNRRSNTKPRLFLDLLLRIEPREPPQPIARLLEALERLYLLRVDTILFEKLPPEEQIRVDPSAKPVLQQIQALLAARQVGLFLPRDAVGARAWGFDFEDEDNRGALELHLPTLERMSRLVRALGEHSSLSQQLPGGSGVSERLDRLSWLIVRLRDRLAEIPGCEFISGLRLPSPSDGKRPQSPISRLDHDEALRSLEENIVSLASRILEQRVARALAKQQHAVDPHLRARLEESISSRGNAEGLKTRARALGWTWAFKLTAAALVKDLSALSTGDNKPQGSGRSLTAAQIWELAAQLIGNYLPRSWQRPSGPGAEEEAEVAGATLKKNLSRAYQSSWEAYREGRADGQWWIRLERSLPGHLLARWRETVDVREAYAVSWIAFTESLEPTELWFRIQRDCVLPDFVTWNDELGVFRAVSSAWKRLARWLEQNAEHMTPSMAEEALDTNLWAILQQHPSTAGFNQRLNVQDTVRELRSRNRRLADLLSRKSARTRGALRPHA